MEYGIHFSKYLGEHELLRDVWKQQIVEANTQEEAIKKLTEEHNKDGKYINYILSCTNMKLLCK